MKLLKKDVLKLIRALKSGAYKKGKNYLVSKDGTKFCCLGVWADIHGCTWGDDGGDGLYPILKGRKNGTTAQQFGISFLDDAKLARGLNRYPMQTELASINDSSKNFKPVIEYIEKEILSLAK